MTKYLGDSFSVFPGDNKKYRENWEQVFGKKDKKKQTNNKKIKKTKKTKKKTK